MKILLTEREKGCHDDYNASDMLTQLPWRQFEFEYKES